MDYEELFRGMIAKDILLRSGPLIATKLDAAALSHYQYTPHEGGSLVNGILTIPFFLLFGDNLISLKLVSFSFSLMSFICIFLFLRIFFSLRVSILSSILFLFAPTSFVIRSLINYGNHTEIILFVFLAMHIFFRIFFTDNSFKSKKRFYRFFLFGIISGFGVYYCYNFLIFLSVCLLFWFSLDKRLFLSKYFCIFLLGFILGFIPWIYYNFNHHFNGLTLYGTRWYLHFNLHNFNDLRKLFLSVFPKSFGFNNLGLPNSGIMVSYSYYIVFIAAFCTLFWLNRKGIFRFFLGFVPHKNIYFDSAISKESFLILYIIFYCFFYVLTKCAPRVLFPLYPFIFIIMALFFNILFEHQKFKIFSRIPLLILPLLGLLSNIQLISLDSLTKGFSYSGFSYISTPVYLRPYNATCDFNSMNTYIVRQRLITSNKPRYVYENLGYMMCKIKPGDVQKILPIISQFNPEYRVYFYRGFGILAWKYMWKQENIIQAIKIIEQVPEEYRHSLYEALFREAGKISTVGNNRERVFSLLDNLKSSLNEKYLPYWYIGLGQAARSYLVFVPASRRGIHVSHSFSEISLILDKIPEEFKPYFCLGLGMGIEFFYCYKFQDKARLAFFLRMVPEKYRLYSYIGLGRDFAYGFSRAPDCLRAIENFFNNKKADEYKYYCYLGAGLEYHNKWMFNEASLFLNKAAQECPGDKAFTLFIDSLNSKKYIEQDMLNNFAYLISKQ